MGSIVRVLRGSHAVSELGLGLHLVRKMADRLEYAYEDGRSRITVTKRVVS